MSQSELQSTFVATLIDEWVRLGVSDAVLCPGSRSTPLALGVAARDEIRLHVRIDERSAGFFAVGCSLRSRRPSLLIVTSGTAAAELHAAVAEADQGTVPLIVITADRPPDLHGVGAPQTMTQRDLFGGAVRAFEEPGVARAEARGSWRPLATRIFYGTLTHPAGPVHLNAAFVEPLLGDAGDLPRSRDGGAPWVSSRDSAMSSSVRLDNDDGRVLVVAGPRAHRGVLRAARERGIAIVGDVTCPDAVAHADGIVRSDVASRSLAPSVIVRTGGWPASKVLQQRVVQWDARVVALHAGETIVDPDGIVGERVRIDAFGEVSFEMTSDPRPYASLWEEASSVVADVAAQLDGDALQVCEPSVARIVSAAAVRTDTPLVVGSSMPVRDLEWWASTPRPVTFANRGVNGIDGVVSTVLGVAAGSRAFGLVGDVTFLHDVSALTDGVGDNGGTAVLVVVDNAGGGIFAFLSQGRDLDDATFSRLFGTHRGHDLVRIAHAFGHHGERVETNGQLRAAITDATERPGISVIVAAVPPYRENVELHDHLGALSVSALEEILQ